MYRIIDTSGLFSSEWGVNGELLWDLNQQLIPLPHFVSNCSALGFVLSPLGLNQQFRLPHLWAIVAHLDLCYHLWVWTSSLDYQTCEQLVVHINLCNLIWVLNHQFTSPNVWATGSAPCIISSGFWTSSLHNQTCEQLVAHMNLCNRLWVWTSSLK